MTQATDGAMSAEDYRAARLALGLTQEKLAWTLHVSTSTISLRERGETPIDHEAAAAIRALVAEAETEAK